MKTLLLIVLCWIATPAFAYDDYQRGYDAGYYWGALPESSSHYGVGVEQGSYDAYQEDMAHNQERYNERIQRRIEADKNLAYINSSIKKYQEDEIIRNEIIGNETH